MGRERETAACCIRTTSEMADQENEGWVNAKNT